MMETFAEKLAARERPITVRELAESLSLTDETICDWIAQKRLPAYRVGKSWRFEPREILEWWQARKVGK
jgi:excisionase family DNA binding protein